MIGRSTALNSTQLADRRASILAEIGALEQQERQDDDALAGLPADYESVEARLTATRASLITKRGLLARIEKAIPEAAKEEKIAKAKADFADLDRKTAKLCRTLEARYTAAATALADVLADMQGNEDEWRRTNLHLHDLGLPAGKPAEHRVRTGVIGDPMARLLGTANLPMHALVVGWDGKPLFRGRQHDFVAR